MPQLNLEIDAVAARRLMALQNHVPGAPRTVASVIQIALSLLERVLQVHREGGEVVFRLEDGTEKLVEIVP